MFEIPGGSRERLTGWIMATQEALIASMRDMYFVVGSERFHDTLMNMTVSLIL